MTFVLDGSLFKGNVVAKAKKYSKENTNKKFRT